MSVESAPYLEPPPPPGPCRLPGRYQASHQLIGYEGELQ